MSDYKKPSYNPVLLHLLDKADELGNAIPLNKQIEMLETYIRFLARRTPVDSEEKKEQQQLIKSYQIELDYLKERKELAEGKKTETISDLINDFAEYFSADADYSADAIKTYLHEWYPRKSFTYFRAKAKKAAIKKCDELDKVQDGTLSNWETNCTEFLKSRTGK